MKIEPFGLERWLLNPSELDLGGAGMTQLKLGDLADEMDLNMAMTYGGVTNGSELLRNEIAALYAGADKDNVLVTTGTAEANYLVLNSLLQAGDRFVACLPSYMQCVGVAQRLGAQVDFCTLLENEGYRLDIERLRDLVTPTTKMISLVNPNNPTGTVVSREEMEAACEIADAVGAWVLCDGALRGLECDGKTAVSSVELYERGIATGSLSKPGLKGLRIGWIVAEKGLLADCWVYKDYTTLSHSGIGEHLATLALERDRMRAILARGRNVIQRHVAILSDWIAEYQPIVDWAPSAAGHTGFIKYNLELDSVALCTQLLEEEHVLLSPGDYFGSPKHVRLRYSCEEETLVKALGRFGAFLKRHD